MTAEQIARLNLGVDTNDARTVLTINAALEWLGENTTIDTEDIEHLPSCAKLFMIKYSEISSLQTGVASESIEGLSQSFNQTGAETMIWDAANSLLPGYMKSRVRFVSAKPRWK